MIFDQIYGKRRRDNQETLGTTDLMQFVQWCTDNTTIPADEDQPFVLKFEYKLNKQNQLV